MPNSVSASGSNTRLHRSIGRCLVRGVTLIEVSLAVAIVGLMAAVAVPMFTGYVDRANISQTIAGIGQIQLAVSKFSLDNNGTFPDDLAELDLDSLSDPWGNLYQYQNVANAPNQGVLRKDRNLVPINTDYDLYSMGKDGDSKMPLTAKASHDDIIRANNGNFIGLGKDY